MSGSYDQGPVAGPYQHPQYQHPQEGYLRPTGSVPPRRSNAKKWIIGILLGILVVCGGGLGACALLVGGAAVNQQQAASKMEVRIEKCTFDGDSILPVVNVEFTVKNNGKSKSAVKIDWEYRNPAGEQVDTDSTYTPEIAPGDTIRHTETTFLNAPAAKNSTCVLLKVG